MIELIKNQDENFFLEKNGEMSSGFNEIKGYILEVFSSKEEMYLRMQEIRKNNKNEACGFTVKKGEKISFYYYIGDDMTSINFNENADNSWHSHPDIKEPESLFSKKELTEMATPKIKELAEEYSRIYNELDAPSAGKPSLTDLINFIFHKRKEDLISMPNGLLIINSLESSQSEILQAYIRKIENYENKLKLETKEVSLQSFYEKQLQYLVYVISEFKNILNELGYEKITENNFLEIIKKAGFSFNYFIRG